MAILTYLMLAGAIPTALAQTAAETVHGVYIFHRHGDRTAKAFPPASLTYLGYREVFSSGQYFRSRYVDADSATRIQGINPDIVSNAQISASAPEDAVLQNSALGFLQGLYPPVGNNDGLDAETLRNGSTVVAPLQGYQLIPVGTVSTGSASENSAWLQSSSDCSLAEISSNEYFSSAQYNELLQSTKGFYQSLSPVFNETFAPDAISYKNAYTLFDMVNVAEIHNSTITGGNLLTPAVLLQLRTLANAHEWGLAYNSSSDIRAVAGMTLASEITTFLNSTLQGTAKMGVQFGAYGSFLSFFGLAGLPSDGVNFTGIVDYASAMVFEAFSNGTAASGSGSNGDEVYVRFLFHNGTSSNQSAPAVYPLFGTNQPALTWDNFVKGMNGFAINTQEQWCTQCGNTTGTCAAYASSSSATPSASSSSGHSLSPAVYGVIGAFVTVAVFLITGILAVLAGLRVVRKKTLAKQNMTHMSEAVDKGA